MQLHDVHQGISKFKRRKRVGRGHGSGYGKTSTRGHKGQDSRSGVKRHPLMEGGQMPLVRRVPKRGFNNARFAKQYATINVSILESRFEAGSTIDEAALREAGLIKGEFKDGLKILGNGDLTKALTVHAVKFSSQASEKIRQAGGQAITVEPTRRSPRAWSPEELEQRKREKPRGPRTRARLAQAESADS